MLWADQILTASNMNWKSFLIFRSLLKLLSKKMIQSTLKLRSFTTLKAMARLKVKLKRQLVNQNQPGVIQPLLNRKRLLSSKLRLGASSSHLHSNKLQGKLAAAGQHQVLHSSKHLPLAALGINLTFHLGSVSNQALQTILDGGSPPLFSPVFTLAIYNKKFLHPDDCIYIGRGSIWGNPFKVSDENNREEAIEKYRIYLEGKIIKREITLTELANLHNKNLLCHCAPKRCHGEILQLAAKRAYELLESDK